MILSTLRHIPDDLISKKVPGFGNFPLCTKCTERHPKTCSCELHAEIYYHINYCNASAEGMFSIPYLTDIINEVSFKFRAGLSGALIGFMGTCVLIYRKRKDLEMVDKIAIIASLGGQLASIFSFLSAGMTMISLSTRELFTMLMSRITELATSVYDWFKNLEILNVFKNRSTEKQEEGEPVTANEFKDFSGTTYVTMGSSVLCFILFITTLGLSTGTAWKALTNARTFIFVTGSVTAASLWVAKNLFNVKLEKDDEILIDFSNLTKKINEYHAIPHVYFGIFQNLNKEYKEAVSAFSSLKSLIMKNTSYKHLASATLQLEKDISKFEKEVNEKVCSGASRFDPVVVYLHGKSRVGKTTMVNNYLIPELAKRLKLESHACFNMTRTGTSNYYGVYNGEKFAILDEFGSNGQNDVTVAEFTKIASSGAYSFEGAAVNDKFQRVTPYFIIVCSNYAVPTKPKDVKEETMEAIVNRITPGYKVTPTGSPFDLSTMQHLKIHKEIYPASPRSATATSSNPITLADLLDDACSAFERQKKIWVGYLKNLASSSGKPPVGFKLNDHSLDLVEIECAKLLDIPIVDATKYKGTEKTEIEKFIKEHGNIMASAEGSSNESFVYTYRITGPSGVGKSYLIKQLSEEIRSRTKLPIIDKLTQETILPEPAIYLVEDQIGYDDENGINVHDMHQYMECYDRLYPGSLIFVSDNFPLIRKRESIYHLFSKFTLNSGSYIKGAVPGFYRRFGCDGSYYYDGEVHDLVARPFKMFHMKSRFALTKIGEETRKGLEIRDQTFMTKGEIISHAIGFIKGQLSDTITFTQGPYERHRERYLEIPNPQMLKLLHSNPSKLLKSLHGIQVKDLPYFVYAITQTGSLVGGNNDQHSEDTLTPDIVLDIIHHISTQRWVKPCSVKVGNDYCMFDGKNIRVHREVEREITIIDERIRCAHIDIPEETMIQYIAGNIQLTSEQYSRIFISFTDMNEFLDFTYAETTLRQHLTSKLLERNKISLLDKISDIVTKVKEHLLKNKISWLCIIGLTVGIWATSKFLYNCFFNAHAEGKGRNKTHISSDDRQEVFKARTRIPFKVMANGLTPKATNAETTCGNIMEKLKSNIVEIYSYDTRVMYGFGLHSNVISIPEHVVSERSIDSLRALYNGKKYKLEYLYEDVIAEQRKEDFMIMRIPDLPKATFKDVRKFIISEDSELGNARIMKPTKNGFDHYANTPRFLEEVTLRYDNTYGSHVGPIMRVNISRGVSDGGCGLPWFVENLTEPSKCLMGLHIASAHDGFSISSLFPPWVRHETCHAEGVEDLEYDLRDNTLCHLVYDSFAKEYIEQEPDIVKHQIPTEYIDNYDYYGKAKMVVVPNPPKTKYIDLMPELPKDDTNTHPVKFHVQWEAVKDYKWPVDSAGRPIIPSNFYGEPDTLIAGILKYNNPPHELTENVKDKVDEYFMYLGMRLDEKCNFTYRALSLDEVVNGIEMDCGRLAPLERTAKAGIFASWVAKKHGEPDNPTKGDLLCQVPVRTRLGTAVKDTVFKFDCRKKTATEVLRRYHKRVKLAERDMNLFSVAKTCLKDEKLPNGKLPRIFESFDMDVVMFIRRMAGYKSAVLNGTGYDENGHFAFGMNPYEDFGKLAYSLFGVNYYLYTDVKKFDGNLHPYLIKRFMEMCTDEDSSLLTDLIVNCVSQAYDMIYSKKKGNPSGNPLTTLMNTVINDCMHYVVLSELLELNLHSYNSLKAKFLGDDAILAIPCDIIPESLMNTEILWSKYADSFFSSFGIKVQPGRKDASCGVTRHLDSVTFLSRSILMNDVTSEGVRSISFSKAGGLKACAIVGMLRYVSSPTREQWESNLRNALKEVSIHGVNYNGPVEFSRIMHMYIRYINLRMPQTMQLTDHELTDLILEFPPERITTLSVAPELHRIEQQFKHNPPSLKEMSLEQLSAISIFPSYEFMKVDENDFQQDYKEEDIAENYFQKLDMLKFLREVDTNYVNDKELKHVTFEMFNRSSEPGSESLFNNFESNIEDISFNRSDVMTARANGLGKNFYTLAHKNLDSFKIQPKQQVIKTREMALLNQGGASGMSEDINGAIVQRQEAATSVLASNMSGPLENLTMGISPMQAPAQTGLIMNLEDQIFHNHVQATEIIVPAGTVKDTILATLPYGQFSRGAIRYWLEAHKNCSGDSIHEIRISGNNLFTGSVVMGWVPDITAINTVEDLQGAGGYREMALNVTKTYVISNHNSVRTSFYSELLNGQVVAEVGKNPGIVIISNVQLGSSSGSDAINITINITEKLASETDAVMYGVKPFRVNVVKSDSALDDLITGTSSEQLRGKTLPSLSNTLSEGNPQYVIDGNEFIPNLGSKSATALSPYINMNDFNQEIKTYHLPPLVKENATGKTKFLNEDQTSAFIHVGQNRHTHVVATDLTSRPLFTEGTVKPQGAYVLTNAGFGIVRGDLISTPYELTLNTDADVYEYLISEQGCAFARKDVDLFFAEATQEIQSTYVKHYRPGNTLPGATDPLTTTVIVMMRYENPSSGSAENDRVSCVTKIVSSIKCISVYSGYREDGTMVYIPVFAAKDQTLKYIQTYSYLDESHNLEEDRQPDLFTTIDSLGDAYIVYHTETDTDKSEGYSTIEEFTPLISDLCFNAKQFGPTVLTSGNGFTIDSTGFSPKEPNSLSTPMTITMTENFGAAGTTCLSGALSTSAIQSGQQLRQLRMVKDPNNAPSVVTGVTLSNAVTIPVTLDEKLFFRSFENITNRSLISIGDGRSVFLEMLWEPLTKSLFVNAPAYSQLNLRAVNLRIMSITTVATSTIPKYYSSVWNSRVIAESTNFNVFSRHEVKRSTKIIKATANMMLAGGAMKGVGGAMGRKSEMKHEQAMQAQQQEWQGQQNQLDRELRAENMRIQSETMLEQSVIQHDAATSNNKRNQQTAQLDIQNQASMNKANNEQKTLGYIHESDLSEQNHEQKKDEMRLNAMLKGATTDSVLGSTMVFNSGGMSTDYGSVDPAPTPSATIPPTPELDVSHPGTSQTNGLSKAAAGKTVENTTSTSVV